MNSWITIISTLIAITTLTRLMAQDGSDIWYQETEKLDTSYIGVYVHLDFYRISSFGRQKDTVTIDIDGQKLKFVEHRVDDGYNNWFNAQYLESVDKIDGLTLRIVKFRLDSLTEDTLYLTNYLAYYDDSGKVTPKKSAQIKNSFPKNIIVEVLISAKDHKRRKE